MSETRRHTPAPWKVAVVRYGDEVVGYNVDVDEGWPNPAHATEFPYFCIEREADAHLIAAAPELLGALKAVYEFEFVPYEQLPPESRNQDWPRLRRLIETAIAKAEGQ